MIAKETLDKRLVEIGGCGDGNCIVHKRGGMHTNGGCRCWKDGIKMQQVLRAYKTFVDTTQLLPTYDHWYQKLADRYGEEFCRIAGYFDETKSFTQSYVDVFDLPKNRDVIQFSGAFYPFHEGHLEMVENAVNHTRNLLDWGNKPFVVIHADHSEYRQSKGNYSEEKFLESFEIMNTLGIDWMLVKEDLMPDGCSRNFTRLYEELWKRNYTVAFLCGGDRANFALTFIDDGYCIVSGRDESEMYKKYDYLCDGRIQFIEGNHPASSTAIRDV